MGDKFEPNKNSNTCKSNGPARVSCQGSVPAFSSKGSESWQEACFQLMVSNESQTGSWFVLISKAFEADCTGTGYITGHTSVLDTHQFSNVPA